MNKFSPIVYENIFSSKKNGSFGNELKKCEIHNK